MPCMLKTLHSSTHYLDTPHRARSMADNPEIVINSPADGVAIALMVIFFGLLGTAIVLIAVSCSNRLQEK